MKSLTMVVLLLAGVVLSQVVTNIFQDTYILDALADISAQTGIPIVVDTMVTGFVTLELNEVPLEQALQMILMPGGYVYKKMDGFYFVGSPDPKNPAYRFLTETEVIKLKHISVADAQELLPTHYKDYVRFSEKTNTVSISAPSEIVEKFKRDLAKIDVPIPQVKVNVVVTEISKGYSQELGLNSLTFSFGAGESLNQEWQATIGIVGGLLNLETDIFGRILSQLKLLEEEEKAKITADPWIIVKSGETASLFLGERQIVLLEAEGAVSRIESIDIGVRMDITPKVLESGEIELSLSPRVSHFVGERLGNIAIKQNEVSTTIRVKNGQTVVIAGATVEDKSQTSSGFPILSRIPLLRYLFGGTTKTETEKELYILLKVDLQGSE